MLNHQTRVRTCCGWGSFQVELTVVGIHHWVKDPLLLEVLHLLMPQLSVAVSVQQKCVLYHTAQYSAAQHSIAQQSKVQRSALCNVLQNALCHTVQYCTVVYCIAHKNSGAMPFLSRADGSFSELLAFSEVFCGGLVSCQTAQVLRRW